MRDLELEEDCPGLGDGAYEITSQRDPRYNCIAWAVGDTNYWWYDIKIKGYYWPPGGANADTIEGWIQVFALFGYSRTDNRDLEPEFEKIAIYATTEGTPEHVARQMGSGAWSSKMGKGIDMSHPTLEALEGIIMGKATVIMKRPCTNGRRVFE